MNSVIFLSCFGVACSSLGPTRLRFLADFLSVLVVVWDDVGLCGVPPGCSGSRSEILPAEERLLDSLTCCNADDDCGC